MTKRMLIDAAHKEEVRVVVTNDDRIEDFEVETSGKEQIKSNIYVAEVTRVEPSLQAAFVNYGGNRNGFLAFSEIHPGYFDLPKEEKEALLKELDEIAAKRRGRDLEAEARFEEEAKRKEEAKAAKADAKKAKAEGKDDKSSETDADTKNDKADESKEDKKADSKKPAKGKKPQKAKDETPESLDGLTPEEMEEDARALAMASTIIIDDEAAPVEEPEAPKKRRGRPSRKPQRHSKPATETSETEADGNKTETENKDKKSAKTKGKDNKPEADEKEERRQPIHRRYNIKDVLKEGSKILIQINKEERGNKGAAVSTYISLPGRYSVLMPNTPYAGGISRKITDFSVRRKIKSIVNGMDIPSSMGVIIRTAGVGQEPEAIEKDINNMLSLWEKIDTGFKKVKKAPYIVHEDGALSIRAIRDMFKADFDEVQISGRKTYRATKDYIKSLMPEYAKKVKEYKLQTPLFAHYDVEDKLNRLHTTRVNLPSGGYLIINPTEALVSVDVNSGKATQEKNIENTALKTNLEAAEEMARQLRLRDLAGLIVIDFIDMEENKNEKAVERMMRKCVRKDRARIQIAPISNFGLLEMSRQRLRPSLGESTTQPCKHCNGTGHVASLASAALTLLRTLEDENVRTKADRVIITTSDDLSLYILNHKRDLVKEIEERYGFKIFIRGDDAYFAPDHKVETIRKDNRGHEKTQTIEVILREPMEGDEPKKQPRRRNNRKKPQHKKPHHDKHANKAKHDDKKDEAPKDEASKGENTKETSEGKDDNKKKRGRVRHLRRGGRKNDKDHKDSSDNTEAKEASSGSDKKDEKKPTRRRAPKRTNSDDKKAADKSDKKPEAKNAKPAEKKEKVTAKAKAAVKERKPAPAKGITVETISETGKSSVSNTKDSVSQKFQRWWNK